MPYFKTPASNQGVDYGPAQRRRDYQLKIIGRVIFHRDSMSFGVDPFIVVMRLAQLEHASVVLGRLPPRLVSLGKASPSLIGFHPQDLGSRPREGHDFQPEVSGGGASRRGIQAVWEPVGEQRRQALEIVDVPAALRRAGGAARAHPHAADYA